MQETEDTAAVVADETTAGAARETEAVAGDVEAQPSPTEEPRAERRFTVSGMEWIARVAGRGAGGTGRTARASLVAIRFYRAETPETPEYEALTAGGRFEALYDEELAALLAGASSLAAQRD